MSIEGIVLITELITLKDNIRAHHACILLLLALFLAILAGRYRNGEKPWPFPPPGKPKDVNRAFFILLDAARADHFSTYGYRRHTTPKRITL